MSNILRGGVNLTVTKPGALTVVFRGGPIGLYHDLPTGEAIVDIADDSLEDGDGLIMIIATVGEWRFILSNTGKLGWVCPDDLGPSCLSGAVYHIDWT